VGTALRVQGVVTAEAGTMGGPPLLAIADDSAGIVVRLPDGVQPPPRGALLDLVGTVAEPYGQRELRPGSEAITILGTAPLPEPLAITAGELGEAVEGRLVVLTGTLPRAPRRSGNNLVIEVRDDLGETALAYAAPAAGVDPGEIVRGGRYAVTGVVGQHASRHGALDGYRIWLRRPDDLRQLTSPSPSPDPSPTPSPAASGSDGGIGGTVTIGEALRRPGAHVVVEGTVTTPAGLLDAAQRRIVIEDGGAGIAVRLPTGGVSVEVGDRIRVAGLVGRFYGAPEIKGDDVEVTGRGTIEPHSLDRSPGPAEEWRLVRVSGRVVAVTKLGSGRWRAELTLSAGGGAVLVDGLPGSRIPAEAVARGASVRVVGVVRRPYPTSRDRRFAIVPRDPTDLSVLAPPPPTVRPGGGTGGGARASGHGAVPGGGSAAPTGGTGPEAADGDGGAAYLPLASLAHRLGQQVRVGGVVADLRSDGFLLDDGTAQVVVLLAGAAGDLADLVEPGDAVAVTGTVVLVDGLPGIRVDDPAAVVRAADPTVGPAVPTVGGADAWGAAAGGPVGVGPSAAGQGGVPSAADGRLASTGSLYPALLPGSLGLVAAVLTPVAVAQLGRRRERRRLMGILRRRLLALSAEAAGWLPTAGPSTAPAGARTGFRTGRRRGFRAGSDDAVAARAQLARPDSPQ
jgi:DNA/RNA endonuclease YhcR with UshA esterase domain